MKMLPVIKMAVRSIIAQTYAIMIKNVSLY
jgi:hypothetical protein